MKQIIGYLKGTVHWGSHLFLAPSNTSITLHAFCDVDWASDLDDRRSTSSVAIFLGLNLVFWWSKKQNVVAWSSIEAEYKNLDQPTTGVI